MKQSIINEFKALFSLMNVFSGDKWAAASMSAYFDVMSHLYAQTGHYEWVKINEKHQFKVGALGNTLDTESPYYDLFLNADNKDLSYIADLLHRYTNYLKFKGLDY